MKTLARDRINRFSKSLSNSLFDKRLELAGNEVVYYYDADVVIKMIMGFELDLAPDRYGVTDEQRLARSLLSCGYLGPLHMLRPHALELEQQLRSRSHYQTRGEQTSFRSKAQHYIREKGIEDIMSHLHDIITSNPPDATDRIDSFLEAFASSAGPVFASLEMVNGTWTQRLCRFYKSALVRFDFLGPQLDEIMSRYKRILGEIAEILKQMRPRYVLSDFRDAVALTILHDKILTRQQGEAAPIVRFYSETPTISRCLGNPRIRALLSYGHPLLGESSESFEPVTRDSSYFIMRAWFPELAPATVRTPPGSRISLERLEDISAEMRHVLTLDDDRLEQAIAHLSVGGTSLIELIETFEQLSIMDSIWTRGRMRNDLLDTFEGWTSIFAFANGQQTGERLFERIEDILEELSVHVSRFRTWIQDFELLYDACLAARERVPRALKNPLDHLGSIRWVFDLSQAEEEELAATVKSLLLHEDADLIIAVSDLASRLELAKSNEKTCSAVCATLWALAKFDMIVEVVQEYKENNQSQMSHGLLLIQVSALMKKGVLSPKARRDLVDDLLRLMTEIKSEGRGEHLLGLAYVLFLAWRQECLLHNAISQEVQVWAQISFEAGEEAVRILPPGSLAWCFAINHCAYVGLVSEIDKHATMGYFKNLVNFRDSFAWSSRFDDTLGLYYLLTMENEWRATAPEFRRHLDFDASIRVASEYFERAYDAYDLGDMEAAGHRFRLERLREEYKRAKSLETPQDSDSGRRIM